MKDLVDELRAEGAALRDFLDGWQEADWSRPTPFKSWTANDVMNHLREGDALQKLTIADQDRFQAVKTQRQADREAGLQKTAGDYIGLQSMSGSALLGAWWEGFQSMCEALATCDPKDRLKWVGPDMSARSAVTARMMETWAHGQDMYDLMQAPRDHFDRIRNIAHLGVNTFAWTFINRDEEIPGPRPAVSLTAPSGAIWDWPAEAGDDKISGSAVEFCQVVTQGRNIQDVSLQVEGPVAERWMAVAQCFAGPPNEPPAPGSRAW